MTANGLPTVVAFGAWLKNAACVLHEGVDYWSPVHGDLGEAAACAALEASAHDFCLRFPVEVVAHDLHADFFSTQLAARVAQRLGFPCVAVQHHHAHIAAVVAEYGFDEPVLGLALDGFGLGTDGLAWGGELLWVHHAQWERLGHLWPLKLPGGDKAAQEPWRMAAAALHSMGRGSEIPPRFGPVVGKALSEGLLQMLDKNVHCPSTSSAGRWFDAAAGALGISVRQNGEAEAAMALERCATRVWDSDAPLDHSLLPAGLNRSLDLRPLVACLFEASADPSGYDYAAAKFHCQLSDLLTLWVLEAVDKHQIRHVCLAGGCFLNSLLRQRLTTHLQALGINVVLPQRYSVGDQTLALGQAWVAAHSVPQAANLYPTTLGATQDTSLCV